MITSCSSGSRRGQRSVSRSGLALAVAAAAATATGLAACGGGSGGDADADDGADTGRGSLYVGYYTEDAGNNPEDPTVGAVLLRLPAADGAFAGQMPFSYAGCVSGRDVGRITGSRSGSRHSGSWTGTMDGNAVGGAFNLVADAAGGSYSGRYTNAAGKQAIAVGACSYYVAAQGTVKLYPGDSSSPAGFALSVGSGLTPTLSWPSLGSGLRYTARLFDEACLQSHPSDAGCFEGEVTTSALGTLLDASFGLVAGTRYRVVVTAQQANGAFAGFATLTFVPAAASGGGSGGGGSGTSRGTLTIGGSGAAALGGSFVSGADVGGSTVTVQTSGPTCSPQFGGGTSCASYLDIIWGEYDGRLPREAVGVHFTSIAAEPGVAPGTGITGGILTASTVNGSASYAQFCGPLVVPCTTLVDLGVTLDIAARTVTFRNVTLPSQRSDGASIVLDGTLTY